MEKERKKDILMSFKRPKWPIRPNKILHLKCCLIFENNKSKQRKEKKRKKYSLNIKVYKIKRDEGIWFSAHVRFSS